MPVDKVQYEKLQKNKIFHPGKSNLLRLGKNNIANLGEISPLILNRFDIKISVYGFEIFLENLNQFQIKKTSTKKSYDNNPLQVVERDFAFLFPTNIKGNDIIDKIKKIDKMIIKNVVIFDIFEGNNLPNNKKSIAIKVTMQPQLRTFTDKEIENYSDTIINLMSNSLDGVLRN